MPRLTELVTAREQMYNSVCKIDAYVLIYYKQGHV